MEDLGALMPVSLSHTE